MCFRATLALAVRFTAQGRLGPGVGSINTGTDIDGQRPWLRERVEYPAMERQISASSRTGLSRHGQSRRLRTVTLC